MKLTIETDTASPDTVGEYLRDWAFTEEVGCYSCFDLIDGFKEVHYGALDSKMLDYFLDCCEECQEEVKAYASFYIYEGSDPMLWGTQVGWFWDGDGDLAFLLPDGSLFTNSDCKKDYTWEHR